MSYFSIIAPARRSQYYHQFYESIASDVDVPFEVIFVGPNPPTESMPNNFKYIVSDVKPAQCLEIAARNAMGEYLIVGGDDCLCSKNLLNRLYNYTKRLDRDKVLVSLRFWLGRGERFGDDGLIFSGDILDSPVIGVCPVFRRDIWIKLGGIDRRFYGPFCDVDMQMRFYEYGMHPFITPDCWINEVIQTSRVEIEQTMCHRHGNDGRKLLDYLWGNKTISMKRLSFVEQFRDVELLS